MLVTSGGRPTRIPVGQGAASLDAARVMLGTGGSAVEVWSAVKDVTTGQGFAVWDGFDDASVTSSLWSANGTYDLNNGTGHLRKISPNGSTDLWSMARLGGDDITVEGLLGPVTDSEQISSILIGSSAQYVFVEFSKKRGVIGDYNGTAWTERQSFGGKTWAAGDIIKVERVGTTVRVYRNGTLLGMATSSVARGASYRRVAFSVRRDSNVFGTYYSPLFDAGGAYLTPA